VHLIVLISRGTLARFRQGFRGIAAGTTSAVRGLTARATVTQLVSHDFQADGACYRLWEGVDFLRGLRQLTFTPS